MPEAALPNGLTLVYDDAGEGWLAGQLKEDPRAISQARTLEELIENIADAKRLLDESDSAWLGQTGTLGFDRNDARENGGKRGCRANATWKPHDRKGLGYDALPSPHETTTRGNHMTDNTNGDRTGIGPQSSSDTKFRRRMRLHQSWYRKEVLGVPYGTGPNKSSSTTYGNMLDAASAERGLNFLSPGIHSLARERIAEGQGAVEPFRLLRNMLTSQAMCFNLFGELALDHGLATALARCLWGEHVHLVTSVRFEWAPVPRGEYLDDATAFDAFIEYEAADGTPGFVGVETKLTEPFSEKVYDSEKYRRWMTPDSPWRADAASEASEVAHNQLWRDHLLAWSMLRHPDSEYGHGRLAVVFHGDDLDTRRVVGGYRQLLRDETTFQALELADVVSAWRPEAGEWLSMFEERYLALSKSQTNHTRLA